MWNVMKSGALLRYLIMQIFFSFHEFKGASSLQMTHEAEMKRNIFNTLFMLLMEFSEMKFQRKTFQFIRFLSCNTFIEKREKCFARLCEVNKLE